MNRGQAETGTVVAVLGGLLLLISLFLDWYTTAGFTVTAWSAFEVWDLLLAVLAVAVIVAAATRLGWWHGPTHGVGLILLGIAALVIVGSQLIEPPPSALHDGIGNGGWLALAGSVLIVAGAAMAESRLSVSFSGGPPAARRTAAWRQPRSTVPPADVAPPAGPAGVPLGRPRYDDPADVGPPPPPPRL